MNGSDTLPLIAAFGISVAVACAGTLLRALTPAGALAASLVGTAIVWPLGWPGLAGLGAFFAGASAISRLAPDRSNERFDSKGPERDAQQVLANGAAAALGALLELGLPGAGLWVATASLAAAAADTWATSTGGWSRTTRHILSFKPVPPGTSGGVSWPGNAGALVGAASVGAAVVLAGGSRALFPLALGVGMLGMLADSVLGAAWQGRFHCSGCNQATERSVHRCGASTTMVGGIRWLTNDGVNALATFFAAGLGFIGWTLFQ